MTALAGFAIVLVCHLFAALLASADMSASLVGPPAGTPAQQMFVLLNGERTKAGLPPLAWDERLAAAAQQHAQLMSERKQLSHQFSGELPLKQRLAAVPLNTSGENVAVGPNIAEAHDGLMHSPPHRANILSPKYDAVGIGVVQSGNDFWITQDFAHRLEEMPPLAAADTVAKAFAQARAEAHAPALQRSESSPVAKLACSMAHQDRLTTGQALQLPEARYAVTYTSVDLKKLPPAALRLRSVGDVRRYAVGVCFARTPSSPSGLYWVVLVLFSK